MLILLHQVISQEVINSETRLTFQFLVIFLWNPDIHLFLYQYVEKTHLVFFRQKSMNRAVVTEQTTEAFDLKLIGFILRGRNQ